MVSDIDSKYVDAFYYFSKDPCPHKIIETERSQPHELMPQPNFFVHSLF